MISRLLGNLTKIFAAKFTCLIEKWAIGELVLLIVLLVVIIIRNVMWKESSISCSDAWSYQESAVWCWLNRDLSMPWVSALHNVCVCWISSLSTKTVFMLCRPWLKVLITRICLHQMFQLHLRSRCSLVVTWMQFQYFLAMPVCVL